MNSYSSFCYSPFLKGNSSPSVIDTQFVFWKDGDFGLCFEEVVILSSSYILLSIISSLYTGLYRSRGRRKRPSIGLLARGVLIFLLLINSLFKLASSFWLVPSLSYSLLLSQSLSVVAWLTHAVSLVALSLSPSHEGFGPLPLNLTWGLTLLSSILRFRTIIRYATHKSSFPPSSYLSRLSIEITCYIEFGVQLIYLLLLLVPAKRYRPGPTHFLGSTQFRHVEEEDDDEIIDDTDELLVTSRGIRDYGSLQPRPSIRRFRLPDALEDRANPFSLLSFWWVQPLMKRGSLGLLRRPQDLPLMPKALWTAHVREKFQRILNRDRGVALSGPELHSLKSMDRLSASNSTCSGPSQEHLPYFGDSASPPPPPTPPPTPPISLIRALNRSFGWHYYPLGIIKLINDVLGFGGPLLLHQLVAFMENRNVRNTRILSLLLLFPSLYLLPSSHPLSPLFLSFQFNVIYSLFNSQEPMSHGYYYALGLFLSTLLTAILNAHFTYQVREIQTLCPAVVFVLF